MKYTLPQLIGMVELNPYMKNDAEFMEALREMVKKAKRYDWLRDKASHGSRHDPVVCLHPGIEEWECLEGEALDAAIDLAIAGGSEG